MEKSFGMKKWSGIMKEGNDISLWSKNVIKKGRIIKIFTKIGYEDHGEEFLVILVYGERGLFNKNSTLVIKKSDLELA